MPEVESSRISESNIPVVETNNPPNSGVSSDPYFVANTDSPTASLVATLFNGTNFVRWRRNVRRALAAKNKEGFINGVLKEPDLDDPSYQWWKRVDYMVLQWVSSSMIPELADDFSYIETVVDLWKELQERFGQSNGPLVYQLKKDLDALKQDNLSILSYYGNTVSNILSNDPLPSLNRAFAIVQQIEKQKEISSSIDTPPESSALLAPRLSKYGASSRPLIPPQRKRDWKKDKMDRRCDHCKGTGHTIDQCFKLIGFPDWYTALKSGVKSSDTGKLAAHTSTVPSDPSLDTPLDESGGLDTKMLSVVCQEVMKAMKGKGVLDNSGNPSYVNFAAGPS